MPSVGFSASIVSSVTGEPSIPGVVASFGISSTTGFSLVSGCSSLLIVVPIFSPSVPSVTGTSSSTIGCSVASSSGASELTPGFSLGRASSGATVPCSSCSVAGFSSGIALISVAGTSTRGTSVEGDS